MNVKQLLDEQTKLFGKHDRTIPEATDDFNDNSRLLIQTMYAEHGQCWLGQINLDGEKPILRRYRPGEPLYNFCCEFILPRYDTGLINIITWRSKQPYRGARADMAVITTIMERINLLNGINLMWS